MKKVFKELLDYEKETVEENDAKSLEKLFKNCDDDEICEETVYDDEWEEEYGAEYWCMNCGDFVPRYGARTKRDVELEYMGG